MQHNLHKSYIMQIMYKNMNEYDYNEEMPVDTRSEKIMRARLAFSDNYEEMQENVGDMQGEEGEDTQAESSPSMSPSPSASPTPDAEERRRKEQEEADRQAEEEQRQQEEARRKAEEEAAKAGNPKIILKNTTVNTTTGQLPAWIDVIGSFQDDKDGYESLFKNLKASKYDVNAKGDHAVTLTTTDSDGNVSDPVSVTVHVK